MRILLSALVTLRWTASVFAAMSLHPAIPFSFIQETMLLPAPPRPTTHTLGRAALTAPANLPASNRSWDAESLSMALVDIGKVSHTVLSHRQARFKTNPGNLTNRVSAQRGSRGRGIRPIWYNARPGHHPKISLFCALLA